MLRSIFRKAKRLAARTVRGPEAAEPIQHAADPTSAGYWTGHNVTQHCMFRSREESLDLLHWRNAQYWGYIDLMPISGFDGKVVIDYGCGPGHDVVGFIEYSGAAKVYGIDVSATSIGETRERLKLHPGSERAELIHLQEGGKIPLPDGSVDYIHSSGVLHHIADLPPVLAELRRVLRPGGALRAMIYNYDSVFVHAGVAWSIQLQQGFWADLSLADAFKRSTDGATCPVSRYYRPDEFCDVLRRAGFADPRFLDAAVSYWEIELCLQRTRALANQRLAKEHREFLMALTYDERQLPCIRGKHAGVDAVFECRKA